MVDYEPLPAVTDLAEAVRPAAHQRSGPTWRLTTNRFLFRLGDAAAVERGVCPGGAYRAPRLPHHPRLGQPDGAA